VRVEVLEVASSPAGYAVGADTAIPSVDLFIYGKSIFAKILQPFSKLNNEKCTDNLCEPLLCALSWRFFLKPQRFDTEIFVTFFKPCVRMYSESGNV
jgi:hypothetical protein